MTVCKETPSETLIIGDLSNRIVDQLASLVDEVRLIRSGLGNNIVRARCLCSLEMVAFFLRQ